MQATHALIPALVAASLAGACKSDKASNGPEHNNPGQTTTDREPSADSPKPAEPTTPQPAAALTFTRAQVGTFDGSTALTSANASQLFPGTSGKDETDSLEGEEFATVTVYRGSDKLLSTADGRQLKIVSPTIKGPGGLAVGSGFDTVKTELGAIECMGGVEDYGDALFCSSERWPELTLVFQLGDASHTEKELDAQTTERVLKGIPVAEIRWSPPDK